MLVLLHNGTRVSGTMGLDCVLRRKRSFALWIQVDAEAGMWRERDLSNDSVTAVGWHLGLSGRDRTLVDVGMDRR
jgi:hypothetical protein